MSGSMSDRSSVPGMKKATGNPRATMARPKRYDVQEEFVIVAAVTVVAKISARMMNELNRYSAVQSRPTPTGNVRTYRSSSENTPATITQTIDEIMRSPLPSRRNRPDSQTSRREDDQSDYQHYAMYGTECIQNLQAILVQTSLRSTPSIDKSIHGLRPMRSARAP